jgi:ABC-type lipoprotein export system ATPase subunit
MSGLANQFPKIKGEPDWNAYLAKLESIEDIPAIGVTDYFSIEGYKKLRLFKSEGRLKKVQLLLPNIEFRLDHIVGGRRVNFHVIFSDDISEKEIEDNFLSDIVITVAGHPSSPADQRKLKRSTLEELGTRLKAEHEHFTGTPYEVGCMNAVVNLKQVMDLLTNNSRFKDRFLTALAEEDMSLMEWNGQDHGVRKLILQSTHILFSGNPKSIAWCLGKKHPTAKAFASEFKGLKPCIIGSDAHELDKIGAAPNGKFTWIKADVSFDGLRQIIFEPEDRVFIGSTPPDEKDTTKLIKCLKIRQGKEWFGDQTLMFNRDLVAIIGGKGSGKTALVDLLAYAGGDFSSENEQSFLNKAREELSSVKLTLQWADDSVDICEISDESTCPSEPKVRYLSQSFVETLCSHDQHEKLVSQIENILFQYVSNDKKLSATDFATLKEIKTRSLRLETDKLTTNLKKLNAEIFNLEIELDSKPDLEKQLEQLNREKKELEAQKPPPTNAREQKEQDELQNLRLRRTTLEKAIEGHRLRITQIDEFRTKLNLIAQDAEQFNKEMRGHLKAWDLENSASDLEFGIPRRAGEVLKSKISEIEKNIRDLEGPNVDQSAGIGGPPADTLASIDKQVAEIDAKSRLEVQMKRKLLDFSKRINDITTRIDALTKTIAALDTTKKASLEEKVQERDTAYKSFFKKLNQKKAILEELYKPLNEPSGSSTERGRVEFYARFNFNAPRFVQEGMRLFDGRRSVIRGETALNEVAEDFWKQMRGLLPDATMVPLQNLLATLRNSLGGPDAIREIKTQLKSEYKLSDVYNWLYCVDYFDVEYGIKYDTVDLEKLSPGRKGVVLLLIYLDVDQDFRPLLIDQPEENLDNRSVYSTLVDYFRKAKQKRQIILVTHNANLVVNCDAEQVIVANFDLDEKNQPTKIGYVSGSLDFRKPLDSNELSILLRQGIREHVCEILEGGNEAFQRREEKYGLFRE